MKIKITITREEACKQLAEKYVSNFYPKKDIEVEIDIVDAIITATNPFLETTLDQIGFSNMPLSLLADNKISYIKKFREIIERNFKFNPRLAYSKVAIEQWEEFRRACKREAGLPQTFDGADLR